MGGHSGEERLRELRLAMEVQNAELKSEIDSQATDVRLAVNSAAVTADDDDDARSSARNERRALLRKQRLEEAAREGGTWSYGWIASIVFGCATVAVLICLFLFGSTPAEAKMAKKMVIAEEQEWEMGVEETYGDARCPRVDEFPIECHREAWLSNLDRCTSLFIYRGWDIDFLRTCKLIIGKATGSG